MSKDAHSKLEVALKALQPCSSAIQPIKAVMDQYGRLQGLGTSSDKDDANVRKGIQPPVRAVARAAARGENVGLTRQELDALIGAAGLDENVNGWMDDDNCEQNWSVIYLFTAPQLGNGGVLKESGVIPITVTAGKVIGNGPVQAEIVLLSMAQCEGTSARASATVSIGGTLQNGTFSLLLGRGGYILNASMTCHFPPPVGTVTTPPLPPLDPYQNVAVSVIAKSGATGSAPNSDPVSISVTMVRRP